MARPPHHTSLGDTWQVLHKGSLRGDELAALIAPFQALVEKHDTKDVTAAEQQQRDARTDEFAPSLTLFQIARTKMWANRALGRRKVSAENAPEEAPAPAPVVELELAAMDRQSAREGTDDL